MSVVAIIKKEFNKRIYDECIRRIEIVLGMLSEEEVWYRPNDVSNSVGHLIIHLCGNVTQWIGSGIGQRPDLRERDHEFKNEEQFSKAALIQKLYDLRPITEKALSMVVDEKTLVEKRSVQCYNETVLSIIMHVIEHFSYHTGQIALIAKYLKGQDLGFYAGIDLSAKSKN